MTKPLKRNELLKPLLKFELLIPRRHEIQTRGKEALDTHDSAETPKNVRAVTYGFTDPQQNTTNRYGLPILAETNA